MQSEAPTVLLETKLYVPPPPRGMVPRQRLSARLDAGAAARLMLVSAPAGFGKTTLLAAWLATTRSDRAVAWVSLDHGDNQPQTFWSYVVAALETAAPGVGEKARGLLRAAPPAPTATVLTTLLNELNAVDDDVVLVLDDYHVVDSLEVHEGMAFLLDHAPPRLHLVVTGRADPALPLARLRARGELVEVRAADLRFTPEEAVEYLNGAMGLDLTTKDVTTLAGRTEGWIAALQLAALSMQGRTDTAEFIAGFAGDARYVVDYLVEEVLARQPEAVERFLLQTSILDRLTGPLCDAVTGGSGGKAMLESLDRANLFLVPLDDRRRWYRYHHLFADVLRARLLDEQPDLVPMLHGRASDWYEANGEPDLAIEHALAAGDADRAADLVELAAPALRRLRQEGTLRRWMEAIPEEQFRARPVLSNGYVGALMSTGQIEGVEPYLRNAERWLDVMTAPGNELHDRPPGMVVVDEAGLRTLPAWVAMHRAGQALMLGDPAGCIAHARRVIDLADPDDGLGRGAASALIGLASWGGGDVAAAQRGYAESWSHMQRAGHIADIFGLAVTLGDLHIVQGRLREAARTYEAALRLGSQDGPVLRGTSDMYVGLAVLHREQDDLATATELLHRSEELGEHLGLPQNPHRWRIAMARVREAEGDLEAATDLLADAERVYAGDFSPDVRPVPAMRARLSIVRGDLDDARRWARERGVSPEDQIGYLREFDHVTLARLLLAEYREERRMGSGQQALELLQRLLHAAEEGGRTGTVIEILSLQALTHQARGDTVTALAPLERALALAEPEDYVRTFTDEGPPMNALLAAAADRGIAPTYVRRLLGSSGTTRSRPSPAAVAMAEPLSARELDVLRLLATDLSGPDIARQLSVSLNTVRTHTKNIYTKLSVTSRRAAVRRASELDLL